MWKEVMNHKGDSSNAIEPWNVKTLEPQSESHSTSEKQSVVKKKTSRQKGKMLAA
jgi:hypothetical protein